MSVSELRDQLGRRVDAAHYRGEPTVIEKSGEPRAVLVPYAWWAAVLAGSPGSSTAGALEGSIPAPADSPSRLARSRHRKGWGSGKECHSQAGSSASFSPSRSDGHASTSPR